LPELAVPLDARDPAALVAAVEAQGKKVGTPCGAGDMAWRIWGEGPQVVLLHGGHGAWSHWIRNIPVLAQRFTVIVPDMPGFGDSASPPDPYTADSMAAIMAAGLDRILGEREFSIVGFSFGGVMGGHLAKERAGRVKRVVLVGSGGLGLPRPKMGEMKNWKRMDSEAERREAHRNNLGVLMLKDPANIEGLALHLQATNTVRTRINSRKISLTDTLRRALEAFSAPLAGIWGTHDATASGEFLDAREGLLKSLDPAAEFVRIDGGHWIQFEAPEAFHAAVIPILENGRKRRGVTG
jgi:2-hydroxy-6-oxonona-2,4-dienedioate hydrolase